MNAMTPPIQLYEHKGGDRSVEMIERICRTCHKRIKPESKLKIYCKCDKSAQ